MPRKNGCPFSVRDWSIDIRSRTSTNDAPIWIPIKGLLNMTKGESADTEDGSSAQDAYGEPYATKWNSSVSLEVKPIYDPVTGSRDPGQVEMESYKGKTGCDGDMRLRIADPIGNVALVDTVLTSVENGADETSTTLSYEMEGVGEPEIPPYVQMSGVDLEDSTNAPVSTLAMTVNTTKTITVVPTPANASNQKYGVASADESKVRVVNKDGMHFDVLSLAPTSTPVNVVVRTVNNSLTATIAVTVTAS